MWDQVAQVDIRPYVVQYTVYENGIPVQTSTVNQPREYTPVTNTTYQIFTEFEINGVYSSEFSCIQDFTAGLPPIVVVDDYYPSYGFDTDPVSVTKYGFIINREGNSIYGTYGYDVGSISITKYSFVTLTNNTSTYSAYGYDVGNVSITRFSSGSIGG